MEETPGQEGMSEGRTEDLGLLGLTKNFQDHFCMFLSSVY